MRSPESNDLSAAVIVWRAPSSLSHSTVVPGVTVTEQEIIDFCAGKIATFRVPRYVRFVTEWPMSGTKIKKAILRELIAADLKDKGITRAPKIAIAP